MHRILLAVASIAAVLQAQPKPAHNLVFNTPATVWDEALPLGNGMLGALVWGDGKPLRVSLDRADLWDARRVPDFDGADHRFRVMREWHQQGRIDDLLARLREAVSQAGTHEDPRRAHRVGI